MNSAIFCSKSENDGLLKYPLWLASNCTYLQISVCLDRENMQPTPLPNTRDDALSATAAWAEWVNFCQRVVHVTHWPNSLDPCFVTIKQVSYISKSWKRTHTAHIKVASHNAYMCWVKLTLQTTVTNILERTTKNPISWGKPRPVLYHSTTNIKL